MIRAYDRKSARELVPLLEVITRELSERMHEVRVLQGRLLGLAEVGPSTEVLELRAALAGHRREIRRAHAELERLGCVLDKGWPQRVLIPGADGRLEGGYTWDGQDPEISLVAHPSAA